MTRDEIERKVVEIVAEKLDIKKDQLKPGTRFVDDLGADSLDIAELTMEFEDEFGLDIPEDQDGMIRTVGDAVAYIEQQLKQKEG